MLSLFAYAHLIIRNTPNPFMPLNHLIILPCHSIWSPGPTIGQSSDEWSLADFQIEGKDHLCFIDHIKKSLGEVKKDENAFLIISGGQTKKDSGPKSEAYSYYQLAKALHVDDSLFNRIGLEEFARDSFENVLFLICRYYEFNGTYPQRVTVVGFEFKRERFVKHHLQQALNFPGRNICYIGNSPDPEGDRRHRLKYFEELELSELKYALSHFQKDWYGINNPLLAKKKQRNPFHRTHGYAGSNPKLASLFLNTSDEGSTLESKTINLLVVFPWI